MGPHSDNRTPFPGHVAPTARWVIGRDPYGDSRYLIHNDGPRFTAKIGRDENEGVLSGLSYELPDGRSLYDFIWLDPLPNERAFRTLMSSAVEALATHRARSRSRRLSRDTSVPDR